MQFAKNLKESEYKSECAPQVRRSGATVCSSSSNIAKLKEFLNKAGGFSTPPGKPSSEDEIVITAIEKTGCDSESCLYSVVELGLDQKELHQRFKPVGPNDSDRWLSDRNIDEVLAQFALIFPLEHLRFHMSDFASFPKSPLNHTPEIWPNVIKTKKYMACVLNTDVQAGNGIHWVCFFVDFEGKTLEYFDSAASSDIKPDFNNWLEINLVELNKLNGGWKIQRNNTVQHQHDNTECGVYSLYYILSRLHGVKYEEFNSHETVDTETMRKFRQFLFRAEDSKPKG